MGKFLSQFSFSMVFKWVVAAIAVGLYLAVFTLSAVPSVLLFHAWVKPLAAGLAENGLSLLGAVQLAFGLAVMVYAFVIAGIFVSGILIRLLHLGIKPGKYKLGSPTFLRWLIMSAFYGFAVQVLLPLMRMTHFVNVFYALVGCRMGKNVVMNSWTFPDAYLLELGDNVIIGAKTEITCHLVEGGYLYLMPVRIGAGTLVGAHCYIAPGVEIGEKCSIGLYSVVRRKTKLPDKTRIAGLAGLPLSKLRELERKEKTKKTNEEGK